MDNLSGDASLNWITQTASRIVSSEIGGTAKSVGSVNDAYLAHATHFVQGYFSGTHAALRFTIQVEDAETHKMVQSEQIDGPLLASLMTLSKKIDPQAQAFSTTNEDAVAAWGRGEYEKAVTLDPQFGTAWLAWIETVARSNNAAAAVEIAGRALQNRVNSEVEALRIQLVRATLQQDAPAEHEALVKLTARVADPTLLANLGALEIRTREFALAEKDYLKILATEPDNSEALNLLSYAYGYDGKVAEAEAMVARYAKLPGQQPNSFDTLGEVYFMNGKFADAEKAFLRAHELNAALLSGGDLRKAAYARWLAGDLPGADQLFLRYLDARAKLRDPVIEWEHAAWEFSTGRKDQAIARIGKTRFSQSEIQARIWKGDVKLPSDPAQLKRAYEATQPAADGLFRTLYAEALVANAQQDEAKKLITRWPLPDSAGDVVLQSIVFPKYMALRRILGL